MDAKDGLPERQLLPPEYTAEQLGLLKALERQKGGFQLDKMLQGAIWAMRQEEDPESFVHAAQSARELIEKFEQAMHGLTDAARHDPGRDNYKVRTDGYEKKWSAAKSGSRAFAKGVWKGKIDAPLGGFLDATREFFDWYAQHDIYRKGKEKAVVLRLDPMFSALSENDQQRVTREWVHLRGFFNRVAHHGEREITKEKMEAELAHLVRYLHRRLAPVDAENKAAIRSHIAKWEKHGVTDEAVKPLAKLFDSGADAVFFFATIQSSEWLPALRHAGYFSSPPPPSKSDDTELHPMWPQSRFLVRIVGAAPAETALALAAIPETKNVNVSEDIFRAASALPPAHIGPLVSRVHKWIQSADLRWHTRALTRFVLSVAGSGNVAASLGILEDILRFKSGTLLPGERPKKGSLFDWTPEPKALFDSYEYGEFLRAVLPTLTKANARRTVATLCRLLNGYIRARGRRGPHRSYDASAQWRPSVDDGSQNPSFDAATELVSALCRVADGEIKAGRLTLAEVFAVTRDFRWDLFRRLEMHWMRGALDQVSPAALRTVLAKRASLRSDDLQLEYGLLLQAGFPRLMTADRRAILRWIDEGPDFGPIKKIKPGTKLAKEAREWANRWRMKKWYWIKDHLPVRLRAKYKRWKAQGLGPTHPGYSAWVGDFEPVRQKSPMDLDDFRAMSPLQQADYLRKWSPTGNDWNGPSRGGLASVFQAAISQDTGTYVGAAEMFIGVPPEYLAAFFSVLWEKSKVVATQPMTAIWTLAHWMLQQPDEETDLFDDFTRQSLRGRRWYLARLALARLLRALLSGDAHPLPIADRPKIWSLLEILATDPDPSVHAKAEQGDDEDSMGPYTLSLNTIRGDTFHAVFEYVAWCRRLAAEGNPKGLPPESRTLLEKHLDPKIEATLTVRSVYGVNINRLMFWDPAWLGENRPKIFPGPDQPELHKIAWTTFITHCQPFLDVLQLLQEEFRQAIRQMVTPKNPRPQTDPRIRLGNYLVELYWSGHIGFAAADDLLTEFFAHAPDDVRAGVLGFIGRSLKSTAAPIAPEVFERLRRLWEWRLAAARAAGKDHAAEIAAFAWWFDSGKLDSKWSAEQMLEALALSRRHEQQFLWMRRFSEMAESETALAVRGLELTVEISRDADATFWNDEEAIRILRAGLKSTDQDIMHRAKRVQDVLLREGRNQFLLDLQ
jgi:hypothetical protein